MRPISTNPGSMEAGECGQTRGTCFLARRLEVVAVAGLLWISWCVLGGANFAFCFFCFRFFFFFERTWPAASMKPPCLIYLFSSNKARFFAFIQKSLFIPRCVQSAINQSVCLPVYVLHSPFLLIARADRDRFPQTRDLWKRTSVG